MGTWGVGLYQCDDASDLRDDFREVVRAPWNGDRLLAWALDAYPAAARRRADGYTDLRLALADLFWTYGIEQRDVFEAAFGLVEDGTDLESKRRLGMSDRDLKKRGAVLATLAVKWRTANPTPRDRRVLNAPQPFLLMPGDCFSYPTSEGRVRNPYVSPAQEDKFYEVHPWNQDGCAAAIVLACVHRFETFARYLVAILRYDGEDDPVADVFPTLSILHSRTFSPKPQRRVHLASTTRTHMKRMGVSVVANLPVNGRKVEKEFAHELRRPGRELANDAWTLPDTYRYQPDRLSPADVRDPIAAFLE
jgi:hypothetical protein